MRKGRIGIAFGGVTLGLILASAAPTSALMMYDFDTNATDVAQVDPKPQVNDPQGMVGNVSNQADNFLNNIIANANENTCLQFSNHEYEVCTAYIFNAAMADLLPYYQYANNGNTSLARLVSYRLDSRYVGQANTLIRNRVAHWPVSGREVDVPVIRILSVNASLANNTASLTTQESWLVYDGSGQDVYTESNVYHMVTMRRIPSYVLHKWVVTDIE